MFVKNAELGLQVAISGLTGKTEFLVSISKNVEFTNYYFIFSNLHE